MRKEYYYLISGLPDLFFDATKLSSSVIEFKQYLSEQLTKDDYALIESYFWRFDNQNLLLMLGKLEDGFNAKGNLSKDDFENFLLLLKEETPEKFYRPVPSYFENFIVAYREENPVKPGKSWENQITEMYYEYLLSIDNQFIRDWYRFEMDLNNILTASGSRKFKVNIEPELIGNNELNEKLMKSQAKDFGIGNEFPKIDEIFRALEETNLLEREKKISLLKWDYLNENTFFHYFTIERIFAYLQKLEMVERWTGLDKETGRMLFNKLLNEMETSQKFPEEFSNK